MRGRRPTATTGWSSSACTRRSSRSSTTSTACEQATKERAIDYPVAVDNDYAIWSAFDQPLLAGALLRRRRRPDPRPPLRRGPLRAIRARDPVAARHRARARLRRGSRRRGRGRLGQPPHARDVSRLRPRRELRVVGRRRAGREPRLRAPRAPAPERVGPRGRVDDRTRARRARSSRAAASPIASTRATRTSCCSPDRMVRSSSECGSTESPRVRHMDSTSTPRAAACSATAACISSCDSPAPSTTGCWRSRSSTPAPRRTCSRAADRHGVMTTRPNALRLSM